MILEQLFHKSLKMNLEIITKHEFSALENKLEAVIKILQTSSGGNLDKVYNTVELAKTLNVSTKTIQSWRDDRLIEFSQVRNSIFYTQQAVNDFLKNHTIKRKFTTFKN